MNPFARRMASLLAAAMLMLPAWSATASEGEDIIRSLLPEPAAGFEWVAYRNCAFLKPSGWNQLARPDAPDAKTIGAVAVSPEATWEENWKRYGTPMLGRLAIIPSLPPPLIGHSSGAHACKPTAIDTSL